MPLPRHQITQLLNHCRRNPYSTKRDSSQSLWLLVLIWTKGSLGLLLSSHFGIAFHYNPGLDPLLLGIYDFLLLGFSLFCLSNSFRNSLWVVNGLSSCKCENVSFSTDSLARYRILDSKHFSPQHLQTCCLFIALFFPCHIELLMIYPLSPGSPFLFEWPISLAFRTFPLFLVSKMLQQCVLGWVYSSIICIF